MTNPHEWMSFSQAAKALGVSRQYAHRLITQVSPDSFQTAKVGDKALLVRVSDIETYKESRRAVTAVLDSEEKD